MTLEDILTIALLVALFLFSVWLSRLINGKGRTARTPPGDSATNTASPSARSADTERDIEVTFSRSGKRYTWDPREASLLDFAESRGIDIDCQCRAGECGTCETRLLSGEVEYRQPPRVVLGEGYCLMCISIPKSDVTLES